MKHIEMKKSPDSELQIESICSIRILNILEVLAKMSFSKIANCSTLVFNREQSCNTFISGEFQAESCLRHPFDEFVMCLLCYGRELEVHIEKVAKSNGKINEEFEYAHMLASDSLRLADKRRLVH